MGRKANSQKDQTVIQAIQANDNLLSSAGVAKATGLHPQEVSRILGRIEETTNTLLQEDTKGRLGIFKRK